MILDQSMPGQAFLEAVSTPDLRIHFSQFGEDCGVWAHLSPIQGGFYVDVGCHHPFRYSNTHLLHRFRGWRGLNIDADPRAIELFNKARPNDKNINVGVGLSDCAKEFAVFKDGAVNTFDEALRLQQSRTFELLSITTVRTLPLATILDEHMPHGVVIDYLNIDCEGLDLEIVQSNDWSKYRPQLVTIEVHDLDLENPLANSCVRAMRGAGYRVRSHYFLTTFFERL
jgi:FkbM family methyltransferase